MEREADQPSPDSRTRYLNIVYFVESARSHTIRINLIHARWAIGAGILVFAWGLGSIIWINSLANQIKGTRQRLEYSLATIFDYQVKNDKVFDLAYPPNATDSYYSESAQLSSNSPTIEKPKSAETETNTVQQIEIASTPSKEKIEVPVVTTPKVESGSTLPRAEKSNKKDLIAVSNSNLSKQPGKVSLVFDINNHNPEKAEGYIWAIAEITDGNGHLTYVAAPEHTKIDPANGEIKNIKTAYRFSIQRFKNKSFDFKTPTSQDWKLSKLTIHFASVDGTNESRTDIPLDQLALIKARKTSLNGARL